MLIFYFSLTFAAGLLIGFLPTFLFYQYLLKLVTQRMTVEDFKLVWREMHTQPEEGKN